MKRAAILVMLVACGGGDDGPEIPAVDAGGGAVDTQSPVPQTCAVRAGTYRMDWIEETGTCGAVDSGLTVIDDSPAGGGCQTAKRVESADGCEVSTDVTCPFDASLPGWTTRAVSAVRWSTAGDAGTGSVNITIRNDKAALKCTSLYRVTYLRQ